MNELVNPTKLIRTAEQKAEEKRLRELHKEQPIREVPGDTISGAETTQLLGFIASVRRERESQGLSVEQLAERVGIDSGVLSRWESGQAFNASSATLFRLARALGRSLTLALDGTPAQTA